MLRGLPPGFLPPRRYRFLDSWGEGSEAHRFLDSTGVPPTQRGLPPRIQKLIPSVAPSMFFLICQNRIGGRIQTPMYPRNSAAPQIFKKSVLIKRLVLLTT
jgi:hypothetical protein